MEYIPTMADVPWGLARTETYQKHFRHYEKNHPNELAAVLNNLTRYMVALNVAPHPRLIQAGYLHHEPAGVVAIDQRGGEGRLQATRLYTYAYEGQHPLSVGDWKQTGATGGHRFLQSLR